ncbi:MAG TPA: phosphate ABC transporter permease PstA [Tepidisphaeraceae bacterium]|nr:phosphate ABC transporter permease PstA [Tepidisphaeraceae bacterium]
MKTTMSNILARWSSRLMVVVCCACAIFIIGLLAIITGYLLVIGVQSIHWSLFTHLPYDTPPGMKDAIVGTLYLVAMASVIGIPLGMLAGIHLAEYESHSRLATPARFVADVLAGVPSIVVGVLGYQLVVKQMGQCGLAGALALAFIMIPIVARTTEEMLRLVPNSYREASVALGASRAHTILGVVIPAATGSLVTGVLLAIARVAGETAPLLFTIGTASWIEANPARPFPALTIRIFNLSNQDTPAEHAMAWAGILVLIGLIFFVNIAVRYFTRQKYVA